MYLLPVWFTVGLLGQTALPPPVTSSPQTADPGVSSPSVPGAAAGDPATPAHRGQILIQSHGEPPAATADLPQAAASPSAARQPQEGAKADVSDAERGAITVTSYDLDARVHRLQGGLEVRARLTLRNDGAVPLRQLPLQISSSLHWESATLLDGARRTPLALAQHRLDTDADHTGAATEALLALPTPLAPGALLSVDLFYSGRVTESGDRLARLGAGAQQQQDTDWDGISRGWTGLRGFGNVLWYPVASPQLFLSEGNTLFTAIGRMRRREEDATVRLRLSVEYEGEPPAAAYFCGRRSALKAAADDPEVPIASSTGIATAEFPAESLGFRLPSLFIVQEPELLLGGTDAGTTEGEAGGPAESLPVGTSSSNPEASSSNPQVDPAPAPAPIPAPAPAPIPAPIPAEAPVLHPRPPRSPAPTGDPSQPIVALASPDPGAAAGLGAAADGAAVLLRQWLGARPLSALTVLDHTGQPFQDGPLLVAPAATLQASPERPAMVYSLTHAWVQTGQPWMDEGLAQFFALLAVEREAGRTATLNQLNGLLQPVALAEPDLTSAADVKPGQPIITATDEIFYRRKAAAVWWMLHDLAGNTPLQKALTAWRTQPESAGDPQVQALAFEHLLEKLSGRDLAWFFADWVLRDRGLPDLSLVDVATSQTPAGPGHSTGFLVAVTVRNSGGAVADVPLVVQSGQFTNTQRIRVPGFSQTTERVLVQTAPTAVIVNDGSTPELTASTHTRTLQP